MNSYADHGLDEDAFGEKRGGSGLRTFDAFREYFLKKGYLLAIELES